MISKISVVMADDHPIVRQGLRRLIERDATLEVVAEADDGQQALEFIKRHKPQVAVLDIDMPRLDGFAVARALHTENLHVSIVFLTMHQEEEVFHAAMKLGVKGYVLKESAVADIVASIKTVATGRPYISPTLSPLLLHMNQTRNAAKALSPLEGLSPTERLVMKLVAADKSTREIAAELFISPRTVDTHRANICKKLDLPGNHALLKYALMHKAEL